MSSTRTVQPVCCAARRLPQIPFLIVGWGDFERLRRAGLPGNIELTRFVDRDNLAARMSRARIFVLPTQVETFGLAVVEAMASGCAIVSSSGLPFHGKRIDCSDVDQLVTAIADLWAREDGCRDLGRANHELAQRYTWEHHIDRLLGIYRALPADSNAAADTPV